MKVSCFKGTYLRPPINPDPDPQLIIRVRLQRQNVSNTPSTWVLVVQGMGAWMLGMSLGGFRISGWGFDLGLDHGQTLVSQTQGSLQKFPS